MVMMLFTRMVRWAFALLLIMHGFAHLPGVLGSWKVKSFEDVSYQPNAIFTDAGDTTVFLLGIVWFTAAIGFLVAGISLLVHFEWWPHIALGAMLTSLIPTILWNQDARIGLELNIALLIVILGVLGRNRAEERNRHVISQHMPSHA